MPRSFDEYDRNQARKRLESRLERAGGSPRSQNNETRERSTTLRDHQTATRGGSRVPRERQGRARGQSPTEQRGQLSPAAVFIGLLETYGLRFIAIVAFVALLIVSFFLGTLARSCSNEAQNSAATATSNATSFIAVSTTATTSAQNSTVSSTAGTPASTLNTIDAMVIQARKIASEYTAVKVEDLTYILEESLAEQLIAKAKGNADISWIASNSEAYGVDGWAVQYKILKLAADDEAAATYVRNWPDKYPTYEQNLKDPTAIQTKATGPHNIPLLYQWDPRWGYTVYSSTAFGMTGCCPTTLAMVYQGLTGKTDKTPYDMGVLAKQDGYMSEYEGTDASFLIYEAEGLGLVYHDIYATAESLVAAIEAGQVAIVNVGPGDFTTDGHFIVVTGLQNGKLIVNDPYSSVRSAQLWDPQDIINQTKQIMGYTKA